MTAAVGDIVAEGAVGAVVTVVVDVIEETAVTGVTGAIAVIATGTNRPFNLVGGQRRFSRMAWNHGSAPFAFPVRRRSGRTIKRIYDRV